MASSHLSSRLEWCIFICETMQRLLIEIRVLSHRKLYWKEGKTIKTSRLARRLDKVEAIDASSGIAVLIQRQFCEAVNREKSPNLRIHPLRLKAETLLQLLLGIVLSLKLILCLLYVSWLPGTPFKFGKVLVFSYMEHNKI